MKDEEKSIVDIRLMQVEANKDWPEAQGSDPILVLAAKKEDKRPTRN